MNKGYLPGLRLDPINNRIVAHQAGRAQKAPLVKDVAFKCDSCGAANHVQTKGGPIHCGYCGTAYVPSQSDSFMIE